VAQAAIQLGKGTLLAKIDIKSAYRLIPVHPHDRKYLGMLWKGNLYIDAMLPFGLRSAPKIYPQRWQMLSNGALHKREWNIFSTT
jgi:hypothetical protein